MSQPNVMFSYFILMMSAFITIADGYYCYIMDECLYSSHDLSDMVYLQSYWFNMVMDIQYNSTLGKFVGLTEYGEHVVEGWNRNLNFIQQMQAQVDTYCKPNAQFLETALRDKAVQPKVMLRSVKRAQGKHPAMLMCSVYDFYPEQIKVSWLRDGEPVASDVTSILEMADGDWYYQIHSELEYTPRSGEKISCVVDHASFNKPMIVDWDPSLPESERNKIVIGASGLVLGIVIAAAGLIYYKKKSTGRILVPH
ncbi:H-2 class II histocompatibility antigen, E-S beta chain-like [Myxocyprinus asiaticus]|uniref:H-2 class II histocompatibility antigen, E-S beta chain-like n=1 Tax=Myxocyprinus asiaticus TaxID=70543 RepID=UPI002221F2BA|nr:H-2 class II histocompatibility antigen, E-S beta chain-like [Myxocyprinus asiaticus]